MLKIHPLEATGGVVAFWGWADSEVHIDGTQGRLDGITMDTVDAIVGKPGLAAAMKEVGWLEEDKSGLIIPNADRYMGRAAKERAIAAERQRRCRSRNQS